MSALLPGVRGWKPRACGQLGYLLARRMLRAQPTDTFHRIATYGNSSISLSTKMMLGATVYELLAHATHAHDIYGVLGMGLCCQYGTHASLVRVS